MNNPLNRRMFRQGGMSKQPMGILASSPELMTTAQQAMMKGKPIKASNAVSVNTTKPGSVFTDKTYTQQLKELAEYFKNIDFKRSPSDLFNKVKDTVNQNVNILGTDEPRIKIYPNRIVGGPSSVETDLSNKTNTLINVAKTNVDAKDNTGQTDKANALDNQLGIKEDTFENKINARVDAIKKLFNKDVDEKDIRTDFNYNLMMTGLLVAAGESPDAFTNLAKGLAAGLGTFGKAKGEEVARKRKEDQAVKLLATEFELKQEAEPDQIRTLRILEKNPELLAISKKMKASNFKEAFLKLAISNATSPGIVKLSTQDIAKQAAAVSGEPIPEDVLKILNQTSGSQTTGVESTDSTVELNLPDNFTVNGKVMKDGDTFKYNLPSGQIVDFVVKGNIAVPVTS
jgi:hypothetical protein